METGFSLAEFFFILYSTQSDPAKRVTRWVMAAYTWAFPRVFWSCPKLGTCDDTSSLIFYVISNVLSSSEQPWPLLAVPAEPLPCYSNEVIVIGFATLPSRRRVLVSWKSPPFRLAERCHLILQLEKEFKS